MASLGSLPFLSFATIGMSFGTEENPHLRLMERGIDRRTLLDISPDREELFMSDASIEEYREALKLRGTPSQLEWLYMSTYRKDVQKLRNTPDRTSAFLQDVSNDENGIESLQIVRQAEPLSPFTTLTAVTNLEGVGGDSNPTYTISWDIASLSTRDVLVSPRPLGPTHICVLIEDGSAPRICGGGAIAVKQNRPLHTKTVDQPINDLLFTLNAPNLLPANAHSGLSPLSSLPRRLHKQLPRVGIRVPHLDTFPALVIYLHTKNQAELFRKIIPEFIRDVMHPLFIPKDIKSGLLDEASGSPLLSPVDGRESVKSLTSIGAMLSRWLIHPFKRTGLGSVLPDSIVPADSDYRRTSVTPAEVDTFAREIVDAARALGEDNVLIQTASSLNALRDNLLFVGYLEHTLWEELELSRQVLLRAIGIGAAFNH